MQRLLGVSVVLAGVSAMVGCGSVASLSGSAGDPKIVGIRGKAFGGEQPIGNSSLQIYVPGTGGYGTQAQALLATPAMSDSSGNFSFSFSCPTPTTLVYLVLTGGNPGLAAGTNNSSIALVNALGPCGSISGFVVINELSTVAAVYALAPFMTDYAHVGTSTNNTQGLTNAFKTAALLSTVGGTVPGNVPSIATVPVAEINTLADALAACTNSTGTITASSPCGRLFAAAMPPGGTQPADLAAATLDIALYPEANASGVYQVVPTVPAFQPTLVRAPQDWTIGVTYAAPAFSTPADLAVDSLGQVWVLAAPGTLANGSSTVSTLTLGGIAGTYPQQSMNFGNLAIDSFNQVWLTNTAASNVVVLSNAGVRLNAVPYTGGGLIGPGPLAFDPRGNVWIVNNSATITELAANGQAMPNSPFSTGGAHGPVAIAIDTAGDIWTADSAGNSVTKLLNSGVAASGSPYTSNLSGPAGIAFDSLGQTYVPDSTNSSLTRFAATGAPPNSTEFFAAGITTPLGIAVDGASTVWMPNSGANTISAIATVSGVLTAESTPQGYGTASLQNPYKVAIDGSGNVWVANLGTRTPGSGVITQLVGAAAPVVTPMATAVMTSRIATRP